MGFISLNSISMVMSIIILTSTRMGPHERGGGCGGARPTRITMNMHKSVKLGHIALHVSGYGPSAEFVMI